MYIHSIYVQIEAIPSVLLFSHSVSGTEPCQVNGAPAAAVTGAERDDGSERTASRNRAEARADAALVTVKQKIFLKRVVQLGLRRRPTEVLGLMEDVKREGFPPFNIYM